MGYWRGVDAETQMMLSLPSLCAPGARVANSISVFFELAALSLPDFAQLMRLTTTNAPGSDQPPSSTLGRINQTLRSALTRSRLGVKVTCVIPACPSDHARDGLDGYR